MSVLNFQHVVQLQIIQLVNVLKSSQYFRGES